MKIGCVNGQFVINPDVATFESCDLNLKVAGTAEAVMMVEGGANEQPEAVMIEAIETGSRRNQKDCRQDSRTQSEGR